MSTAFELNPDFRHKTKRNADGSWPPCCAKCQRKVDPSKTRKAWVNWDTWAVALSREEVLEKGGHNSEHAIKHEYIGPDCWKIIGLP